jgi:hypothetical protein
VARRAKIFERKKGHAVMSDGQQQYLLLIRLAWSFREVGVGSLVELLLPATPAVVVPLASGRVKITAVRREGVWFYVWGHGRKQSAWVGTDGLVQRVARWAER